MFWCRFAWHTQILISKLCFVLANSCSNTKTILFTSNFGQSLYVLSQNFKKVYCILKVKDSNNLLICCKNNTIWRATFIRIKVKIQPYLGIWYLPSKVSTLWYVLAPINFKLDSLHEWIIQKLGKSHRLPYILQSVVFLMIWKKPSEKYNLLIVSQALL